MGWVKLDDGFPMHPKVVGLSLEARWAYIESLCYAACYRTDGVVPDVVAANGFIRAELVAAGLWEKLETSVSIHDYLAYNLSREEADALSSVRSRAGAKGGALAQAKAKQVSSKPTGRDGTGFEVEGGGGLGEGGFEAFWAAYPRHDGGKVRPRAKFESKVHAGADPEEIVAGACRYRDDPNRDAEFTAHATTWLNQERWSDPPLPARNGQAPRDRAAEIMRGAIAQAEREPRAALPGGRG